MEIDAVDGGGDIVLTIYLSLLCGGHFIPWTPTRTKMALAVTIIWLAEIAKGEDMLEIVNILPNLTHIQHHRQRIETGEHEPLCECHTIQYNKVLWLVMVHVTAT